MAQNLQKAIILHTFGVQEQKQQYSSTNKDNEYSVALSTIRTTRIEITITMLMTILVGFRV